MIRGIYIDPVDKSVSSIEFKDNLENFYNIIDCRTIDCVALGGGVMMYIDDEGRLKNDQNWFKFKNTDATFCGKAILTQDDGEGGNKSLLIDTSDVLSKIEWLPEGYDEAPMMRFTLWH